jgi:hypothetical protein
MEKIEMSQKGLEKLLDQSLKNFQEERDLALERYRRQDEMMTSAEDFIIQGKNAVDFLKTAADRSNAMLSIAKLIKDVVYKDDNATVQNSGGGLNDEKRKELLRLIKDSEGV